MDMVVTDDGCRLWTTRTGRGQPLVLCHGGPGFWDTFGDLAGLLGDVAAVHRWDQRGCGRSDRRGPFTVDRARALEHAERELTPYLGTNWACGRALNADRRRSLGGLLGACRALPVPILLVDGAQDIRPRRAVDSLERALPDVRRVVLDGGHLPWVEQPAAFRAAVARFLLS